MSELLAKQVNDNSKKTSGSMQAPTSPRGSVRWNETNKKMTCT